MNTESVLHSDFLCVSPFFGQIHRLFFFDVFILKSLVFSPPHSSLPTNFGRICQTARSFQAKPSVGLEQAGKEPSFDP